MNISLPQTLRRYVETRIESGGFANASEYIRHIIRAEAEREPANQRSLEQLLTEGLESGPTTAITRKDWKGIRKRGIQRVKELKIARRKTA